MAPMGHTPTPEDVLELYDTAVQNYVFACHEHVSILETNGAPSRAAAEAYLVMEECRTKMQKARERILRYVDQAMMVLRNETVGM